LARLLDALNESLIHRVGVECLSHCISFASPSQVLREQRLVQLTSVSSRCNRPRRKAGSIGRKLVVLRLHLIDILRSLKRTCVLRALRLRLLSQSLGFFPELVERLCLPANLKGLATDVLASKNFASCFFGFSGLKLLHLLELFCCFGLPFEAVKVVLFLTKDHVCELGVVTRRQCF